MPYQVIGEAAMLLHFAFLAYVALGGFLAWRWTHAIWPHTAVALYGFGISLIGWECPLTHVENWARQNAGQQGYTGTGFMEHYLSGVIYPENHLIVFQLMVGTGVTISWAGFLILRHHRTRHRHNAPTDPA